MPRLFQNLSFWFCFFDHHKKTRTSKGVDLPSKCDKSFRCQTCSVIVDHEQQDKHRCGEHVCRICKEYVLSDHLCYMQPERVKTPNNKIIFYDSETDFCTGVHVIIFIVAQCSDGTEFVFKAYDALNEFCLFLFSLEHKGLTVIAHNATTFDGVFVQRWLIDNRPTADMHVIHSGQKVMQLTVKEYNIRLTDSLNFLQMPLSKFPKTFGLDLDKFSKGDFPFKFNTLENQNYIGPMPDIEYYSQDTKSEKGRKFFAWHEELTKSNYIFDIQKEMYIYCSQDVTVLRLCCLQFRDSFLSETSVRPLFLLYHCCCCHGCLPFKISKKRHDWNCAKKSLSWSK